MMTRRPSDIEVICRSRVFPLTTTAYFNAQIHPSPPLQFPGNLPTVTRMIFVVHTHLFLCYRPENPRLRNLNLTGLAGSRIVQPMQEFSGSCRGMTERDWRRVGPVTYNRTQITSALQGKIFWEESSPPQPFFNGWSVGGIRMTEASWPRLKRYLNNVSRDSLKANHYSCQG